jgi:hypothetical protein
MVGCRPLRTCVQLNVNHDKLKNIIYLPFLQNVFPRIFSDPNVEQMLMTHLGYQRPYLAQNRSVKRAGHKCRRASAVFNGIRKFPIEVYQVTKFLIQLMKDRMGNLIVWCDSVLHVPRERRDSRDSVQKELLLRI